MKTATTRNASAVIAAREDFKTSGALHGEWNGYKDVGRLPNEYKDAFYEAVATGKMYAVYSYATPIAWYTEKYGWVIPPVKYSPTTTKHQGNLPARIVNGILVNN